MARKGTELKLGVETLEARTVLNATVTLGPAGQGVAIAAAGDAGNDTINVFMKAGKLVITDTTGKLTLDNLAAAGDAKISASKHTITFAKGIGHGDLSIAAGQSDKVTVGKGLVAGKQTLTVGGNLTINEAGKAAVTLNGVAVNNETNVTLAGVSSTKNDLTIVNSHLGLNVEIDTTGNNKVSITKSKLGSDFTYKGSTGTDGGVDNLITNNNEVIGDVNVSTGAGNDNVVVTNSFFLDPVTLNGGAGVNTLTNTGNNFQKTTTVVLFS